jgi:hypothetical protein
MIGASRLLVRLTLRIRPFCRSSLPDEMAIWFRAGEFERARLMRVPSVDGGGEAPRFDIVTRVCEFKM